MKAYYGSHLFKGKAEMKYLTRFAVWGLLLSIVFTSSLWAGTQTREAAEKELARYRKIIDDNNYDFTVGLNDIMLNYTPEERQRLLGLKLPDDWEKTWREHLPENFETKSAQELPSSFNWRDSGLVTPVKNQMGCGSCWIFSAIGGIEGQYMVDFGIEYDLSEQEILSCRSFTWGCEGGWMTTVYDYVKNYGIGAESDFPYYANDDIPCLNPKPVRIARGTEYVSIPGNVDAIKTALLNGPVISGFAVEGPFYGYTGGCYSQIGGDLNHGVVIVGWDDNYCDGGGGAWCVKNSWGPNWGDNGFFWVRYGHADIGSNATQVVLNNVDVVIVPDDSLPDADMCDGGYNHALTCGGGYGSHTWSLVDGSLPPGVNLNPDGTVGGVPEEAGYYDFTASVADQSDPPYTTTREFGLWVEPVMNGDADCNKKIDVIDIVDLIKYKFKDGPPPVFMPEGCDTQCDHGCDVLDILGLINYKFKDGPYPCQYQY